MAYQACCRFKARAHLAQTMRVHQVYTATTPFEMAMCFTCRPNKRKPNIAEERKGRANGNHSSSSSSKKILIWYRFLKSKNSPFCTIWSIWCYFVYPMCRQRWNIYECYSITFRVQMKIHIHTHFTRERSETERDREKKANSNGDDDGKSTMCPGLLILFSVIFTFYSICDDGFAENSNFNAFT